MMCLAKLHVDISSHAWALSPTDPLVILNIDQTKDQALDNGYPSNVFCYGKFLRLLLLNSLMLGLCRMPCMKN